MFSKKGIKLNLTVTDKNNNLDQDKFLKDLLEYAKSKDLDLWVNDLNNCDVWESKKENK